MSRWAPVRAFVLRAWSAVGHVLAGGGTRAVRRRELESTEWVAVEDDVPEALGEMFCDLLSKAGIPVLVRDAGGALGRGALGGVPTSIRLLVPAERAAEAREVLDSDNASSDEGVRDGSDGGEETR